VFDPLRRKLSRAGIVGSTFDLVPNDGHASIAELAANVARHVDRVWPRGEPIDLVGFSMGGLVARYFLLRLGGLERVRRFVTVGSPHRGTLTAHLRNLPGCIEMRPASAFLRDLERDEERLGAIDTTSIWTPLDLMVVPAVSSRLSVGREVLVPAPLHAWLLRDPRSLRAIVEALSAPLGSRTGPRR
jgi:triacylglycerol lipase